MIPRRARAPRILVAEHDDHDKASSLASELRSGGYSTVAVQSGAQVLGRARNDDFDLLILELDLPGSSAQHMLRTMRATGVTAPVIVLSRAGDDAAPLLESGADDHMVTPYHIEELLARVRARLRHVGSSTPDVLSVGDVHLDRSARQCTRGDRAVALTALEFDLVDALLRHPSQTLTRDQLLAQTRGPTLDPNSNVIDVYVGYLRRKLGADIIHTVRGVGYRLGA